MSLLRRHRYAATIALLVVGVAFVLSFNVIGASLTSQSYTAEEVDPTENLDALTESFAVAEFDPEFRPDAHVNTIETAVADGSSRTTVEDQPGQLVDPPYEYLVVDGSVYTYSASQDGDIVEVRMEPVEQDAVAREVATPIEEAPPAATEAIETGEAESDEFGSTNLVRDGDIYYSIQLADAGAFAVQLVVAPIASLLVSVGAAFIAVGGWLLYSFTRDRPVPLTEKRATLLSLGAAPVAILAITLFRTGGARSFGITTVLLSVAAGSLLLVGVLVRKKYYRRVAGVLIGMPFLILLGVVPSLVLDSVPAGVFSGAIGLFGLLLAGIFGFPLVVYGYRFSLSDVQEADGGTETTLA